MRTHTKTFHIRFTEKEYARLCKYAEKAGLPKTTYIRQMINGCRPKEKPPAEFWEFKRELYALGNNLNQLAHLAHRVGGIHTAKLDEMNGWLNRLIIDISNRMMMPEKVDIPATLELGRQAAEMEEETL
jgi:iron-sulfur cluster repair protein YtfE (RIC family)